HRIHPKQRLVSARFVGVVTGAEIFDYQRTVWAKPEVQGFDELVDTTGATKLVMTTPDRVRELADLSASMDPTTASKFAIVATDSLAYGLGQMYGARRDMNPSSAKRVEVFRTREAALEWLGVKAEELEAEGVG